MGLYLAIQPTRQSGLFNYMSEEIWKPVVGYEGFYEVSNMGRVKSMYYRNTKQSHILKLQNSKNSYCRVFL